MTGSTAATQERTRQIVHRTHGRLHGPIIRLMSPSDLGQSLKPFVFLDLFDDEGTSFSGFGWHPHSGIATLTYLWEGSVRYEDTTGAAGFLPAGGVEWFKAAGGAWHGGGAGNSGRSRGFQLWLALPAEHELGSAESIYQKPQDVRTKGPAAVLLGTLGEVSSPLKAPSSINYLAVRLKAGQTWRYEPPADHTICWVALASGRLADPEVRARWRTRCVRAVERGDRLPCRSRQRIRPRLGRKPSVRTRPRKLLCAHESGLASSRRTAHRRDKGAAAKRWPVVAGCVRKRWNPFAGRPAGTRCVNRRN